jgi:hypothetical protein
MDSGKIILNNQYKRIFPFLFFHLAKDNAEMDERKFWIIIPKSTNTINFPHSAHIKGLIKIKEDFFGGFLLVL